MIRYQKELVKRETYEQKDFIVVMLLALLIPAWMFIDRQFIAPKFNTPTSIPAEVDPA